MSKWEFPKLTKEVIEKIHREYKLETESIKFLLDKKKILATDLSIHLGVNFIEAQRIFNLLINDAFINNDGVVNKKEVCRFLELECFNVVFLDVDGVLNCRTTKDKVGPYRGIEDEKVKLLKNLVESTHSKIVLISSWNECWEKNEQIKYLQDDLANYLDEKLAKQGLKIFDKPNTYVALDRGASINEYISELKLNKLYVDKFVILDDETFDYKQANLLSHFIQTSFENGGLQVKHIRKAKEKLL